MHAGSLTAVGRVQHTHMARTSGDAAHSCCQSMRCRCSWPSLDTTAHRSIVGHQHDSTMSELRGRSLVRVKAAAAAAILVCLSCLISWIS